MMQSILAVVEPVLGDIVELGHVHRVYSSGSGEFE